MDRYAVINEKNEVVNVIAWDGQTNWTPPNGFRVQMNDDVAIGDMWIDSLNEFVRPLSRLKPPEDEASIMERKAAYLKAKELLKSGILFLDQEEHLEI